MTMLVEKADQVGAIVQDEVRLGMIVFLGACGFAIGFTLLARMLRQARGTATLGLA